MTVSAVSPWRTALRRERCLPALGLRACAVLRVAAVGLDLAERGHCGPAPTLVSFCNSPRGCSPAGQVRFVDCADGGACGCAPDPRFGCRQRMRFKPKRAGIYGGVDSSLLPPRGFIAVAVHFAMVSAA